jgi:hypothetical protein
LAFSLQGQVQQGTVLWTYELSNNTPELVSSPAVSPDGIIYVNTGRGLSAITNTGSAALNKWTFAGTFAGGQGVRGSPAIGPDLTLYCTSGAYNTGNLYAVRMDGSLKWFRSFGSTGRSSPAIGPDGTVYLNAGGQLNALTPSGAQKWSYPVGGYDNTSPVVGADGTIYLAQDEGWAFFALNPDGSVKWSKNYVYSGFYMTGDSVALGADGAVFIYASDLLVLNPDGAQRWSHPPLNWHCSGASPVLGEDGSVYISDQGDSALYKLTPNGELVWSALACPFLTNPPPSAPAIDRSGKLYYSVSNSIFAVSPEGQVLWGVTLPGISGGYLPLPSPTIGPDGTVYAVLGTTLYAIFGTNSLAASPWPMYQQNVRHTGRVEKPSLQQPQITSDANFQFQIYGLVGQTYTVQAATNLGGWSSLTNILVNAFPMNVADLTATNAPSRFYRLKGP